MITTTRPSNKFNQDVQVIEARLQSLNRCLQLSVRTEDIELQVLEISQLLSRHKAAVIRSGKYNEFKRQLVTAIAAIGMAAVATTGNFQVTRSSLDLPRIENLQGEHSLRIAETGLTGLTLPSIPTNLAQPKPSPPLDKSNFKSSLNFDHQVTAIKRAILGQESGGNYRAVNPHSGALGYLQIMPQNLPTWTREALGYTLTPKEFLNSPQLQLKVGQYKIGQYLKQQSAPNRSEQETVRRVASLWYSGNPRLWNHTKPQFYKGHPYPSIAEYTASVWERYLGEKEPIIQRPTYTPVSIIAAMERKGMQIFRSSGELD